VHKQLLSEQLFIDNPHLLAEKSPYQPNIVHEDEGIARNLVGRLALAAVVKSTFSLCRNAIYRTAGIELPKPTPLHKTKAPRQENTPIGPNIFPTTDTHHDSKSPLSPPAGSENLAGVEGEEDATDISDQEPLGPEERPPISSDHIAKPAKTRTVLPALSVGYIPAEDLSDPDEEIRSFAPLAKPRKNRRGQRERRGIWLKKYGANARHLHSEPKDHDNTGTKKQKAARSSGSATVRTPTENAPEVPPKKPQELHPSWAAKQRIHEQQKAILSGNKPKRIVFD
jgi:hypothetical protein